MSNRTLFFHENRSEQVEKYSLLYHFLFISCPEVERGKNILGERIRTTI